MNKAAVVTALNEAATIGLLVRTLKAQGYDVVMVNDYSSDDTGEIAKREGACVLTHLYRAGIAMSLMHAWRVALARNAEYIVQLDAGGSHDPMQADSLLEGLYAADVVIGSRFMKRRMYAGGTARKHMSQVAALMCNLKTGKSITDWTSGYRAFRRDALETLLQQKYAAKMHGWQIEVLYHAIRWNLRIAEVPITYTGGQSSFNGKVAREAYRVWRGM